MGAALPSVDLEFVLQRGEHHFKALKGSRILFTGGTGLFGRWLLSALSAANDRWGLNVQVSVLSREPELFFDTFPSLNAFRRFNWIRGDVLGFRFQERCDFVVHAALPQGGERASQAAGIQRVLGAAIESGARRFLLTSSGAVYGKIPSEVEFVPEDFEGEMDLGEAGSGYGLGKRDCEKLLMSAHGAGEIEAVIARSFAVVGPHLPLNAHFAIGNFIRNGLSGEPILVSSDGLAVRSYLHLAEHSLWLWAMLVEGRSGRAYNVGSQEGVSILNLAKHIGEVFGVPVHVAGEAESFPSRSRYLPDTSRARTELGLKNEISLVDAIQRTVVWHRDQPQYSSS